MSKKAELVGNYFGTIYLTVISLLQGIALSQLAPNIIKYSELAEQPWSDIRLLPLILMLLIIFNVWHHYAIGIFFLRWFPNIIDTLIPFVISMAQFFLIAHLEITDSLDDIDVHKWMIGFAGIMMLGCFAYFGAVWRLEAVLFTNIMSHEGALKHTALGKKYYMIAGISVLIQGLFATLIVSMRREDLLIISFILFIAHLVLFEYFVLRYIKPHFVRAMDDFDEKAK